MLSLKIWLWCSLLGLSWSAPVWAESYTKILEKRNIRLAVEYDRTLYYSDRGRPYGLALAIAHDLSKWLSDRRSHELKRQSLTVQIIPVPKGSILDALDSDKADIALGRFRLDHDINASSDLIIRPSAIMLKETLVTGRQTKIVKSIVDLSGRSLYAAYPESSYRGLDQWNNQIRTLGKTPLKISTWPDGLEDEDMLQMINAGLIDSMLVADWKAQLWKFALPNIIVQSEFSLQGAGTVGWAVSKSNSDLATDIDSFVQQWVVNDGMNQFRTTEFKNKLRSMRNPTTTDDWMHFKKLLPIFQKYSNRFNLDPLMLAALGFQETELKSVQQGIGGAIGVMQLMPSTGVAMEVGDIHQVEPNIHAAAKLFDLLLQQHFSDSQLTTQNRTLFAIASYNAGPNAIASLRKQAEKQGFDPNIWLNNVEIVAAEKIGIGVMTYVRNVYRYFIIYTYALKT